MNIKLKECSNCGKMRPRWSAKTKCCKECHMKTCDSEQKKLYRIKPVSDKQAERLKEYRKVRDEYMATYLVCEFPECQNKSQDLHHGAGRIGDLLTNTKYFVALCRMHHQWAECNPEEAKKLGISFSRLDK